MLDNSIFKHTKRRRKLNDKLRSSLLSSKLLSQLYIRLALIRSEVLEIFSVYPMKSKSFLFDTVNSAFYLFSYYIFSYEQTRNALYESIETPLSLYKSYNMDIEIVFHTIRSKISSTFFAEFGVVDEASYSLWNPIGKLYLNLLQITFPEKFWDGFTPLFYSLFWFLTLQDVKNSKSIYRDAIKVIESNQDMDPKDSEREVKMLNDEVVELTAKQDQTKKYFDKMREILLKGTPLPKFTILNFINTCIRPRVLLSPEDALYCSKYVKFLNKMEVHFFSTIQFYHKISSELLKLIPQLSNGEANHLGIFFNKLWKTLHKYNSKPNSYLENCAKKPGFCSKITDLSSEKFSYERFSLIFETINTSITDDFVIHLDSDKPVAISNTMVLLNRMNSIYPIFTTHMLMIKEKLEKIKVSEFDDLKVCSISLWNIYQQDNIQSRLIQTPDRMVNFVLNFIAEE